MRGTAPAEYYFNSVLSGLVDSCNQMYSIWSIRLTLYCVTAVSNSQCLSCCDQGFSREDADQTKKVLPAFLYQQNSVSNFLSCCERHRLAPQYVNDQLSSTLANISFKTAFSSVER